jgi:DNA replication and repair protein RecF
MLHKLSIQQFRNFGQVDLQGLGWVTLFVGENGSGKTSLLEAIYCLGSSRSFRTRKWQSLIRRDQEHFVISGEIERSTGPERLGIRRVRGEKAPLVKHRGTVLRSAGELAGVLPLQLIDSAAFQLLEGPPDVRRQWLDWGVFHVEQRRFVDAWRRYRKALQQRNALLRQVNPATKALAPWTEELVRSGELVHGLRQAQFERLLPLIASTYEDINRGASAAVSLDYRYHAGWDTHQYNLAQRLAASDSSDRELGYTRHGPHRADVRIRVGSQPALEVLSRGQLKTVICCIRIAQAKLLAQYGIKSVFLIDDLSAELDPYRCRQLIQALLALDMQLFFTSIQAADLADCFEGLPMQALKRFHVKQGGVSPHE